MLEEAIIFLILYAVLVFTDLVPVYKAKNKKTIIVCTSGFVIAFALQFLIIFDIQLPRYGEVLEGILRGVTGYSGEK